MNTADGNTVLVNAVSSALDESGADPALILRVLEEEAWRSFTTPDGEEVSHDRFDSFVTAARPEGLGVGIPDLVRFAAGDPETLGLMAAALGVHPADLVPAGSEPAFPQPAAAAADPVDEDARHFGRYMRAGGWLFGLLVARNVRPGSEGSERDAKVSIADFALRAGCSKDRVSRYYHAWERAADAGVVPAFGDLTPGIDIELPEPELWSEYFTSYERGSERRENIAEQATADGTSYGDAVRAAEHPSALRTAILADFKTAEAARQALVDRLDKDEALQVLLARDIAAMPEMRKAVAEEAKRTDQAEYVRKVAESGKARIPSGEIALPAAAVQHIAEQLPAEVSSEDVAVAYETVQALIAEAVEADPEVQLQERRHKFRKAIVSSAKQIESIDQDGVADLADDELRETIIALQERINALASQLAHTGRLQAA